MSTLGTCLASPEGFNSKLEPVNSGVAWTTTFNAVGTADANGNVTELGQSVDSASFGVGPRMHLYRVNIPASLTLGNQCDMKTGRLIRAIRSWVTPPSIFSHSRG